MSCESCNHVDSDRSGPRSELDVSSPMFSPSVVVVSLSMLSSET